MVKDHPTCKWTELFTLDNCILIATAISSKSEERQNTEGRIQKTDDRSQYTADITMMTVKSSWNTADPENKHIEPKLNNYYS